MRRTFSTMLVVLAATALAHAAGEPPMGVTSDAGSTTFRVWAPNARSAAVIGEFNNWTASAAERMTRGAGGVWSATLQRSRPKGAYGFLINGDLQRRDPYARAVTPDGRKSLFYDPAAFNWGKDRPVVIPPEDLVIYELHVGTFADPQPQDGKPATFYDAIKRLDQLVELGVNCVEVMPIHEFNGMHSWGYNPCDMFAVEQAYGGPDGFKTFVQACHARGLAVHLDIVHNHYGPENLDLLRFDGSGDANEGGIYFYSGTGIAMTPWGPRVKFDEPQVVRFIRDNAFLWIEEYRVDGFRWDSTINIRAYNDGNFTLQAGTKMLEDINLEIRNRYPNFLSIAEDALDVINFHGSWDYDFHHAIMPFLKVRNDEERNIGAMASAIERETGMWRVIYVDNHDEAGKINGQFRIASDIDPGNPASDYARRLCGLGALFTLTSPGIPLIFMGNEMMESGTFHDNLPLDWGKWTRNAGMVALHRDLIRLRRNLDGAGGALKGRSVRIPVLDDTRKQLVYWRWSDTAPDDRAVIAVNLSGKPATLAVAFPSEGPWQLRLDTDWGKYGGGTKQEAARAFTLEGEAMKAQTTLAPYSARIYFPAKISTATPAAAPVRMAAPKEAPAPAKPAFSMYAAVCLVGDFNGGNLTNTPMKLVADDTWEFRGKLGPAAATTIKLSANADGRIFWGGYEGQSVEVPCNAPVKRLGQPITVQGGLNGYYIVRFHEQELTLKIDPWPEGNEAERKQKLDFRTWTDAKGNRLRARFVSQTPDAITLQREDGRTMNVPPAQLSEKDRKFVEGM